MPTEARFIELRNIGDTDANLTGWYIQRKTATGSSFSSLVTSTNFEGKSIKAGAYFLISRDALSGADIVIGGLTLTEGNTLRMRNADGEDVDQVEWGSISEGSSYQKLSSGAWATAAPTPGSGLAGAQTTNEPEQGIETTAPGSEGQNKTQTAPFGPPLIELTIKAYAGADRTALAGGDVLFEGKATGLKGEPLFAERFSWNFGDGAIADGENVRHTFRYPGNYIVVLHAVSGKYAASDYARVRVIPADIIISGADVSGAYVEIKNNANMDIDVSLFRIRVNGKEFLIPDHTILAQGAAVRFAQSVTGLSFQTNDPIMILYPNGETLFTFLWNKVESVAVVSSNTRLVQAFSQKTVFVSPEEDGEVLGASVNEEAIIAPSSVGGAAESPANKKDENSFAWWGALFVITALSAGSVVWVRRKERGTKGTNTSELSADDFDIIEINEK